MSDTKNQGFYNIHSGLKGRDGGPYLDQIERQVAEERRAVAEGREPNYSDPLPATAGTPLVPAALVVDNSLTSNPSMANRPGLELILEDSNLGDNAPGDASLVKPTSVLPVDLGTEPYDPEAQEMSVEDQNLISSGRADQASVNDGTPLVTNDAGVNVPAENTADVNTDNGDNNVGQ